jgi:hypothetical protein
MIPTAKNFESALANVEMDNDLRKIILHILVKKFAPKKRSKKIAGQAVAIYYAYPRHIARPVAVRAIEKALVKCGFDHLLSATQQFAKAWAGTSSEEMQYCPHPATWYNQMRYNDDPSTWERHGKNKNSGRPVVSPNANTLNDGWASDYKKGGGLAPLPDI